MTNEGKIHVFPELERGRFPFYLLSCCYGIADATTQTIVRTNYETCTVEFVLEGKGVLEIDGQHHELGANSLYILHKGSNHQYAPDRETPWKKLFFVIDGALMEYLFRIYDMDTVYAIKACPHLRGYFEDMFALKQNDPRLHRQAAVIFHRLLDDVHESLYEPTNPPPETLMLFRKYLDDGIEKKVSLQAYCADTRISKSALIRKFKKHYALTPYDYLMCKRIESAKLLLRHSTLTIKEIAYKLQFCDPYHFSNTFKRKTGLSPRNYRG